MEKTDQRLLKTDQQLVELRDILTSNQTRITVVENQMGAMENEIKKLKTVVNFREHQSKNLCIRIMGIAVSEEESGVDSSKVAAKLAYDRVLKPLLAAA